MVELIIYKDNYLIEASYKLTLDEQRLMLYCIGKLNPVEPVQKQEIIIEDFAKNFRLDKNSAYQQVKKAIENIYNRSIKVRDPKQEKEFRWIQEKTYIDKKGIAIIEFSNAIMPYLCQLENQFTKYQLKYISDFKSVYSIRVYELLTQFRTLKNRTILISELRDLLNLNNKFLSWNDLKRSVIDKSVNEINSKSDLRVEYVPIKKGRSFVAIEFFIEVDRDVNFLENKARAEYYLKKIKNTQKGNKNE